jgi:hypothetical protein
MRHGRTTAGENPLPPKGGDGGFGRVVGLRYANPTYG